MTKVNLTDQEKDLLKKLVVVHYETINDLLANKLPNEPGDFFGENQLPILNSIATKLEG